MIAGAAGLAVASVSPTRAAAPDAAFFAALRAADLRVASIGYRLATANAALCRVTQPMFGMPVQAIDQFAPDSLAAARQAFGFDAPIVVEAVVPGGPADRAGIRAGDSLLAVNDRAMPAPAGRETASTRLTAEALIAGQPVAAPAAFALRRAGVPLTVTVAPVAGCHVNAEMMLSQRWEADSSGATIRISSRFVEAFEDWAIAAVLAHEMAHSVLAHDARLKAAGVTRGLTAEFGRSARLWRQVEDEADRMSAWLLFNAGFDPLAGARFWRSYGGRIGEGGLFQSNTHSRPGTRAANITTEAGAIPSSAARPAMPPMLALRDQPLK